MAGVKMLEISKYNMVRLGSNTLIWYVRKIEKRENIFGKSLKLWLMSYAKAYTGHRW